MPTAARKEISFSKDFIDSAADSFVVSDFGAGGQDYIRLNFMRHKHIPNELASSPEEPIKMDFYAEALQAVTLPTTVALEMAYLIIASAEAKISRED